MNADPQPPMEPAAASPEADVTAPERGAPDLVLDLTFVPAWARQPPAPNPYARQEAGREPRGGERREGRDRRDRPNRREDRRDRPSRNDGPGGRGRRPEPGRHPAPEFRPRLPLSIWFLPDRKKIGTLAHELHTAGRAYRLADLANLFLSRPEYHAVKLEARRAPDGGRGLKLFQCKECQVLFLDRAAVIRHAQRRHLEVYFDAEDIETDPPSGNFTSVARCTLSGILLGPPNHHSFNQRLAELHAERYAHLSLDEYRKRVEMIRDPALIEQWKQETRRRRVYREKGQEPPVPPVERAVAEARFLARYADALVQETTRVIVPATVTLAIEDPDLKQELRLAWNQESRRAFTLTLSLRPALRHMRFHSFRANGDNLFVTAIPPQPLEPRLAVKPIRKLLNFLKDNPGCNRQQLIDGLRPGAAPESEQVAELIGSLRWLKEKGHIIEFYDGTLAVPRSSVPEAAADAAS